MARNIDSSSKITKMRRWFIFSNASVPTSRNEMLLQSQERYPKNTVYLTDMQEHSVDLSLKSLT